MVISEENLKQMNACMEEIDKVETYIEQLEYESTYDFSFAVRVQL